MQGRHKRRGQRTPLPTNTHVTCCPSLHIAPAQDRGERNLEERRTWRGTMGTWRKLHPALHLAGWTRLSGGSKTDQRWSPHCRSPFRQDSHRPRCCLLRKSPSPSLVHWGCLTRPLEPLPLVPLPGHSQAAHAGCCLHPLTSGSQCKQQPETPPASAPPWHPLPLPGLPDLQTTPTLPLCLALGRQTTSQHTSPLR